MPIAEHRMKVEHTTPSGNSGSCYLERYEFDRGRSSHWSVVRVEGANFTRRYTNASYSTRWLYIRDARGMDRAIREAITRYERWLSHA